MISEGAGRTRRIPLRGIRRCGGFAARAVCCANRARAPRPDGIAEVRKSKRESTIPRFAALNRVRNIAKPTKAAKNGTFFCGSGFQFPRFLSHTAKRRCRYDSIKEALNKSWYASCLHIFRYIARKLLEIHQVFLRHFHTILGAASA